MAGQRKATTEEDKQAAELQESGNSAGVDSAFPEWTESAWRLYARGQRNWSALARQFQVPNSGTVKMWVLRFGQAVAAARRAEGSDPNVEYEAALEEILGQAWADHVAPVTPAQIGALRIALDALEKLAAARGVVTKREAQEKRFPDGIPPWSGVPMGLTEEEAEQYVKLCDVAADRRTTDAVGSSEAAD